MKSPRSRIRTKVVALLASLAALWGFAAFVTVREGMNLLWVTTLDKGVGKPTEALLSALQDERRLTLVYLGGRQADQRTALDAGRVRTDRATAGWLRLSAGSDVDMAASEPLRQRLQDLRGDLRGLAMLRDATDTGSLDRLGTIDSFTHIVDAGFRVYGSLATLDDPDVAKTVRTLVALSRAREVLSQEDSLVSGALAAGRMSTVEYHRIGELIGTQRFLYADADGDLPPADRADYQRLTAGSAATSFRALEDRLVDYGTSRSPDRGITLVPPVTAAEWDAAATPYLATLRGIELTGGQRVVADATSSATWVIVRLALAGGLGLIAVVASVIMSITTARSLVRQLERLRAAAWELAQVRLPDLVARLRKGEPVDVSAEAPPLEFGSDEIGQVGQAFNAVQRTAISAAVEQAELRRGVRDVFVNLARRTQGLVHRQLGVLDRMERRETDTEELDDLFRVDHLATRMRRNAENLIILAGAAPGRGWRQPVPVIDVIRGAVSEVEEYARVTVLPAGPVAIVGRSVGDLIHLLAELIENAVSFSPPYTPVHVSAQPVAHGVAIEIEDRGLGMSESDRAVANAWLKDPPEFNLASSARLGLYVVARLAARHDIRISLKDSPYGGTTAVVLVPPNLVADEALTEGTPPAPVAAYDDTLTTRQQPLALATEPGPVRVLEEPATLTDSGLPRRVRQASLAVELRHQIPSQPTDPDEPVAGRAPEDIRAMMAALQLGTVRGRAEADDERTPRGTAD